MNCFQKTSSNSQIYRPEVFSPDIITAEYFIFVAFSWGHEIEAQLEGKSLTRFKHYVSVR